MGLFDRLVGGTPSTGQQGQQQNRPDPRQGFQQMQADPAGFFAQLGLNVPAGMNDPNEIINHLRSTGQVSDKMYNMAMGLYNKRPR